MTVSHRIFRYVEHVSLSEITLSIFHRFLFRKHLSLLLSGFNSHHQRLFSVLVLIINNIIVVTLDIFLELWGGWVIVVEGYTYPRELDPDPSFVVVQGRLYLSESIVLFYFLEAKWSQGVRHKRSQSWRFVNVQIASFIFIRPHHIFFLFHELFDVF